MGEDHSPSRPVILVADDEDDVRSLVASELAEAGYDVIEARDGDQALRLAVERMPDMAILDVTLPEMNGYEVTERLRETDGVDEIPIILLTASAAARDVTQGFEVGADDYIKKPIGPSDVRDRVQDILGR